jgi:hypothetical protein
VFKVHFIDIDLNYVGLQHTDFGVGMDVTLETAVVPILWENNYKLYEHLCKLSYINWMVYWNWKGRYDSDAFPIV